MQQASSGARAVSEDIATAVSSYFSATENTAQQSSLSASFDQETISRILNDPEFQEIVAQEVQEELEESRPNFSDDESSSIDYSDLSTEEGIKLSEIIQRVRDSRLAQWLGFFKPEPANSDESFYTYTDQQNEQLRIALNGRFSQEGLPELTDQIWQQITTNYPTLTQNVLDGFYGKKSLEEFDRNIATVKEIALLSMPQTSIPAQQATAPSSATLLKQRPQKMASSAHTAPQPNQTPPLAEPYKKQRIISKAPMPKRKPFMAKNSSAKKQDSIIDQALKDQAQENKDIQKLLNDQNALDALIKKAAFIEKQKGVGQKESKLRSEIEKTQDSQQDQLAQDFKDSKQELLKQEHASKKNNLKKEFLKSYKDITDEQKAELQELERTMQESQKEALVKQHQREHLAKKQKEQEEQQLVDKKLKEQHVKQKRFIKKRAQEEKQKLEQEKLELLEREKKAQQVEQKQKKHQEQRSQKELAEKQTKELKRQQKKQQISNKQIAREQKQEINKEESARVATEQQEKELYEQFAKQLRQETQNMKAKQDRTKLEDSESKERKQITQDQFDEALQKLVKNIETLKEETLKKQNLRQKEELESKAVEEHTDLAKNLESLLQKLQDDIQRQKLETEVLEQSNMLEKDLQEFYKNIHQVDQDLRTKITQEKSTADLFEQLPQDTYQPTSQEQQKFDEAIVQHRADIAQKIGQKRDQVTRQQTINAEQKEREALEKKLEEQIRQIQKQLDAEQQKILQHKQQQSNLAQSEKTQRTNLASDFEQSLQDIADEFANLKQMALQKQQLREKEELALKKENDQIIADKTTADLFEQLPQDTYQPTSQEQQKLDEAIAQHRADIAQKIGRKRDQVARQQTINAEQKERDTLEKEFVDQLEKDLKKFAAQFKTTEKSSATKPASYAKEPFSDEHADAVKNMFEQNQPQPSFHTGKQPSSRPSYAKEPFSDEHADAVKNMFEQNQPQTPSNNAKPAEAKKNPEPKPTPPQQDKIQHDSNVSDMKAHGIYKPEKNSDESGHETFKQSHQEPIRYVPQENLSEKEDETKPSYTDFLPSQKKSYQTPSSSKNIEKKEPSANKIQPAKINTATNNSSLSNPKKGSSCGIKKTFAPYFDNDIPTEEFKQETSPADYTYPSYPNQEIAPAASSSSSLSYLAPQELISSRSKQLSPTDIKKHNKKPQEKRGLEKEAMKEHDTTSEFNKDQQQSSTMHKQNNMPHFWDHVTTTINSIYRTIKNVFSSLANI